MPVPTDITDLSSTAASNSPAGSDAIGTSMDDYIRAAFAILNQETAGSYSDVASSGTTDIGAATSTNVRITGTTTITSFGTVKAGVVRNVRFAAALTLTHNGTSLILPGGENITTAANDCLRAVSLGTGNWIVTDYHYASPKSDTYAVVVGSADATKKVRMEADGLTTGTTRVITVPDSNLTLPYPGQLVGTSTNDSASAGNVGEVVRSDIGSGSAVSLTTSTAANVTSISLTAGDWDVYGVVLVNNGGSTVMTYLAGGVTPTSATLTNQPTGSYNVWMGSVTGTVTPVVGAGALRVSVSSTTTYYLVSTAIFTTSTCAAYGSIWARRAR